MRFRQLPKIHRDLTGLVLILGALTTQADSVYVRRPNLPGFTVDVLTQARPDEYFYGRGNPSNLYVAGGIDMALCYVSNNLPKPKVNDSYVWGLAKSGNDLYFGTVANGSVLVTGTYFGDVMGDPDASGGSASFVQVSEFGLGIYAHSLGLPGRYGDWRPPNLYRFNLGTRTLTRLGPTLPPQAQADLFSLEGVRSGGSVAPNTANPQGLVILAGPPLREDLGGGAGFFAFSAAGVFLGSIIKPEYANIRRFVEVNGDLYAGVQTADGYGRVIRIINNSRNSRFPFAMEEVGELDQPGADIAMHEGRLFLTTWPGYIEGGSTNAITKPIDYIRRATGLWMSPVVPSTGLTSAHLKQWAKVWTVNHYEADLAVAVAYGGGALCSFDGWLYFGTMHVPLLGSMAAAIAQGLPLVAPALPGTPEYNAWYSKVLAVYANCERATSVFRGRNFVKPKMISGVPLKPGGEFQLLSGYGSFKVYDAATTNWVVKPNRMGQEPLMAPAGWGRTSCTYTWCMSVFQNDLYIGTLDLNISGTESKFRAEVAKTDTPWGAELIMIPSSRATTYVPVSRNGLGNPVNYGFRTMVATPEALYIGTANPYNLLADQADGLPDGGWELLALTHARPVPFDLDGDFVSDPGWDYLFDGSAMALVSATAATNEYPGAAYSRSAWADYDGDGRTDPAWFTPTTGKWRAALSSAGSPSNTIVATTLRLPANVIPVPADFDGDGCADPAVFNPSGLQIAWLNRKTGAMVARMPGTRVRGTLPAVADYDGDGVADPAWYVASEGVWIIQGSRDGSLIRQTLPLRGVPMPADYDGDGRVDLALHLPLTGEFAVLNYSSGRPAFTTSENLGPSWLPMAGDYDGDGQADFAWYNTSAMQLHILFGNGTRDNMAVPEIGATLVRPGATPAAALYLNLL
jgi:hypothetical protein